MGQAMAPARPARKSEWAAQGYDDTGVGQVMRQATKPPSSLLRVLTGDDAPEAKRGNPIGRRVEVLVSLAATELRTARHAHECSSSGSRRVKDYARMPKSSGTINLYEQRACRQS